MVESFAGRLTAFDIDGEVAGWRLTVVAHRPSGTISRTISEGTPMAITASEARKHLFPLIEQVNQDRVPVEITSKRGDAVLISVDDYRALEETAYLLRTPANVRRLLESLDHARAGNVEPHNLDR